MTITVDIFWEPRCVDLTLTRVKLTEMLINGLLSPDFQIDIYLRFVM